MRQLLRLGATLERDAPESWRLWSLYAGALYKAGRARQALAVLQRAIALAPSGFAKANLYAALLSYGEVGRSQALAIEAALARDGRPGVWRLSLSNNGTAKEVDDNNARLARAHGAWPLEWSIMNVAGRERIEQSEPTAALRYLNRAVAIADSVARPPLQIISYMARGRANAKLGRLRAAEHDLLQAIAIGPAAEEQYYLYQSWHNLAHVYESAGRFREAARAVNQFVQLTRDGNPEEDDHWMSLHDAGTIRWKAGWHAAARADFEAMVRAIDRQNRETQGGSGGYFAGEYYERLGDLPRALAYYRAGALKHVDAKSLEGLVRVYKQLDLDDSAVAAARAHDADTTHWPATEVPLLPEVLASSGRLAEAVRLAQAWVERQALGGHVQATAAAKLDLADLLLRWGRPAATLAEATQADSLARSLTLTDERIRAGELRGRALIMLGRTQVGLGVLRATATLASAHPTAESVLRTQLALGDALAAAGDPAAALTAYDAAARAVEGVTERLDVDLDRAGYRSRHLAPFDGALRLLLHRPPTVGSVDSLLRWSQRRKGAALALALRASQSVGGAAPTPLTLAELRERLAVAEALVDYLVVDSGVAAIVVTRRGADLVRLPQRAATLERLIARLRQPFVSTYAGRIDLARAHFDVDTGRELYGVLVRPLESLLGGADRLAVVPDGLLHSLPFEALVADPDPLRFLIDDYEIAYLPSAQAVRGGPEQGVRGLSLLVVERNAPGTREEVEAIRREWPVGHVTVLEGDAATETAVRTSSHHFAVLHVAAHAEANNADPLASHLRLAADGANDGYYHLAEIAAERGQPQLVVLSACETLTGRLYNGEGLMGLARAFLVGGARSVVATQWPVGSASARLMGEFYRNLAAGQPPARALRAAKLGLRRDPQTADPFYWAGFVALAGR